MFIVAVSDPPRPSDTLTVNVFRPWLAAAGVPDNAPLLATDSHAGPLTLANVSASPFGSVASPAIEELYARATGALGLLNGSSVKVGGALAAATTVIFIVAMSDPPRPSVTLTVNVFRPWLAAAGVPDNAPLLATDSHAGPFTLENVSGSPSGSVASPAIDELYARPTVALGLLYGSTMKEVGVLAAPATLMFIVAMSDAPRQSDTPPAHLFCARLAAAGAPDNAPLLATDSHAGPFTLENVSGSPSGSVASPAIEELYAWPTIALGLVNGSLVNVGGRLGPAAALRITNPINDCRIGVECVTLGVSVAPVADFDPATPSAEVIVSSIALTNPLLTV